MMGEISEYLKGAKPDFAEGFALFCKYSRNDIAKAWIARKHDMPKLLYELGKLAQCVQPPVPAQVVVPQFVSPVPEKKWIEHKESRAVPTPIFRTYDERRTRRADLPDELKEVYDSIGEDYKLRRALHEKMKMALTDEDRASFRERVIDADAIIREKYKRIDSYLLSELKKKEQKAEFKESTARSYISKTLKKETLTLQQKETLKARYNALLEHGCQVGEDIIRQLKEKAII